MFFDRGIMGLRPTQGDENALCPATALHGSVAFPFVIPSAAEGSAVQRTFRGNVFRQCGVEEIGYGSAVSPSDPRAALLRDCAGALWRPLALRRHRDSANHLDRPWRTHSRHFVARFD